MNGGEKAKAATPLAGMTVVVTRPREDAEALIAGIEALGGEALVCPTIRIEHVDAALIAEGLRGKGPFQWLVATSANAVRSLASFLEAERFSGRIAVVGGATARALRRLGYEQPFEPPESTSAALSSAMRTMLARGDRVLLPQSDKAGDELALALGAAGAAVVRIVSYRTLPGTRDDAAALIGRLGARAPDAVVFASPSAVRGLVAVLTAEEWKRLMESTSIVSIGPTTSAQLAALGLRVACEAHPHTSEGLLDALRALVGGRRA